MCVRIHVGVYIAIYRFTYICTHSCIRMHTHMDRHTDINMDIHTGIHMDIHMNVHMDIYMEISVWISISFDDSAVRGFRSCQGPANEFQQTVQEKLRSGRQVAAPMLGLANGRGQAQVTGASALASRETSAGERWARASFLEQRSQTEREPQRAQARYTPVDQHGSSQEARAGQARASRTWA